MKYNLITFIYLILKTIITKDTYITVTSPVHEDKPLKFKVYLSNIGYHPFGHKMAGKVELGLDIPDWKVEDEIEEKLEQEKQLSQTELDNSGCSHIRLFNEKYYQQYKGPVLFLDSGSCKFMKKAALAEQSHAKMLIVTSHWTQGNFTWNFPKHAINNDLSGNKVNIPVLIMEQEDAMKLKELVLKEKQVWISVQFNKPQDQGIADIQYWTLPADMKSTAWIVQNRKFFEKLLQQNKAKFSPHFVFFEYCDSECQKTLDLQNLPQNITSSCLSSGRYCHTDPDGDGPLEGKDSVLQALDELCVAKSIPENYFSYSVAYFTCFNLLAPQKTAHKACHDQAILLSQGIVKNKIDKLQQMVEQCVHRSWNKKYPDVTVDENYLLKEESDLFKMQGVRFYPQLFVNGEPYRGSLTNLQHVQEFVCFGLHDASEVEECKEIFTINETLTDDEDHWDYYQQSQSDWIIYLTISLLALVVFIFALFFYRRKLKMYYQNELNQQVSNAVQQYYQMQDSK